MLYLIQVTGYTALMCLVYILFLRNRPMHAFNRVYLLATAALPTLIPFLKFPEAVGEQIRTAAALGVRLPEVVVGNAQSSMRYDLFVTVYLCVSLVLLGGFIYKLISLRRVIAKSEKIKAGGYTLVTNSDHGPGSWFNYIFLPDGEQNTTIIEHEAAHIRLHHTRDVIFLNVLQLFFWPNLLLVWIKKELMQVHEFQADAAVAGSDTAYSELLVSSAFNRCTLPMSHSFMIHPIRRRLMMLKKKGGPAKYAVGMLAALVTVALFVGVVGIQSCKAKKWEMKDNTVYSGGVQTKDGVYITNGEVLRLAEKMPQFDGDMMAYMANNVKYPEEAREKKVEGKVYVQFVVDPTGAIVNPKVVESESELLSVEALRAVNNMPKWIPGENDGKKVAVMMTLPVSFKLDF